jgi:hypothetical protein
MCRSNRYKSAKHSQKWIVTVVLVFSITLFTRAAELSKVEANHVVQVILVSAKMYKNPFALCFECCRRAHFPYGVLG